MLITFGKWLYGLLFCALLPFWLFLWANLTRNKFNQVVDGNLTPLIGIVVTVTGLLLILIAMWQLWRQGKGLPMNAFPPEHYVTRGIYRWFRHPIYVGFFAMVLGISLAMRSPSGLFLVTPITLFMIVALVLGYELPDMITRWGDQMRGHYPLVGPREDSNDSATWLERIVTLLFIFVPWLLLYYLLIYLGSSKIHFVWYLPGEAQWPVWEWTESIYFSTYVYLLMTPLLMKSRKQLRALAIEGWWITLTGTLLNWVIPAHAPPRPVEGEGFWSQMILWERSLDGPVCALPSFHVLWALVAAHFWSLRFPRLGVFFWIWSLAVSISCVMVGNHTIIDVLSALLVYYLLAHRWAIWGWLRNQSEKLANSWQAWMIGPLRIINHSIFPGIAGFIGVMICGQFPIHLGWLLLPPLFVVGLAGIWGQWVSGSSLVLRPFGYYGGIIGGLLAAGCVSQFSPFTFTQVCAVLALAAPWVQLMGRFRCLVQGCCHGKAVDSKWGIKVLNPHSRVCLVSHLVNVPIHITPLYSIFGNILSGCMLIRLWLADVNAEMLVGLYFLFNGGCRFIEEAYRGEVQTPYWAGLRLYQWLAIGGVITGMIFTCLPATVMIPIQWRFDLPLCITALVAGLLAAFVMGCDFPKYSFRYARLSG